MDNFQPVEAHYGVDGLKAAVLQTLEALEKNRSPLQATDLANLDFLHLRGREGSMGLAEQVRPQPGDRVLDLGCGLGGVSRLLASHFGCSVVGLDLTEDFCLAASIISERVKCPRTRFVRGNALALPFAGERFDWVWTEHVQMNIADKSRLYAEIRRVLRPVGRLAMHDILAGPIDGVVYPLPWAGNESISHLIQPNPLRSLIRSLGFRELIWTDVTPTAIAWLEVAEEKLRMPAEYPLGAHLLLAGEAERKIANLIRNFRSDRLRVCQAVFEKSEP